jgi:3-hydroxypropanoate dehydrogenase
MLDLGVILRDGRTFNTWQDDTVPEGILRRLYDLVSFGPTSTNCQPLRVKFVRSRSEKAKLLNALWPGNRAKTEGAPVTAVLGMDLDFPAKMDRLFAHAPAVREAYVANPAYARETAFRNSSIQGGYFILVARSLGLDCGPLSGFDQDKMDEAFWTGSAVETNFVCNLGYGKREDLFARKPRLEFDEVCSFV